VVRPPSSASVQAQLEVVSFRIFRLYDAFSPTTGFGDVDSSFLMKAGELSRDPA
jgi:hypothetical protein